MIDYIIELLITVPIVLIALTVHEYSHGFIAYKLGDNTAKFYGRLSLNPLKHIDIIGAICMLLFHFGWAKPVPIDVRNFKNPKCGMALSALAGPCANLILGFFGCLIHTISFELLSKIAFSSLFAYYLASAWLMFSFNFAWLNIALAIFNLIPLPPLDGSRIFLVWLPPKAYFKVMKYEREISILFFVILLLDSRWLGGYISGALSYIVSLIYNAMQSLFLLIF